MTYGEIPRGLNDVKVFPIEGVSDVKNGVDVPGVRVLGWNTDSTSDQLEGDDQVIAKAVSAPNLTANIELGRINFAAMAVILGQEVTVDATGGANDGAIRTMEHKSDPNMAFFQAVGQSLDADHMGSAYRVTLNKLIASTGPDESLEVNNWSTPTIDLEGVPIDGVLIVRQQFEEVEDIETDVEA